MIPDLQDSPLSLELSATSFCLADKLAPLQAADLSVILAAMVGYSARFSSPILVNVASAGCLPEYCTPLGLS